MMHCSNHAAFICINSNTAADVSVKEQRIYDDVGYKECPFVRATRMAVHVRQFFTTTHLEFLLFVRCDSFVCHAVLDILEGEQRSLTYGKLYFRFFCKLLAPVANRSGLERACLLFSNDLCTKVVHVDPPSRLDCSGVRRWRHCPVLRQSCQTFPSTYPPHSQKKCSTERRW